MHRETAWDTYSHLGERQKRTGKGHLAGGHTFETNFKNSGIKHLSDMLPDLGCFICLFQIGVFFFSAGWLDLSFYSLCFMLSDCSTVDVLCVGPMCPGGSASE